MTHRPFTRTMSTLCAVVVVTTLALGCSDDDGASVEASGGTTTSTTEAASGPETTAVIDEPVEPESPDAEPATPLLDLVDGSVAGHPLGAPAETVIDHLVEVLGPPELDTGWQPSECPPATEARNLTWNGFFVYFGYLDGQALDGARLDLGETDLDDVPPVRLPDGVEWGAPIDEVATVVGATAIYDEAFDWWEIWAGDADTAVQYFAGPEGVLEQVMLGYVPVCR